MPRRKIEMAFIDEAASRTRTFKGRKAGLKKKARELSVLCGVDVAVVWAGPGGGAPDVWEFGSAGVIGRYRRLPADKRAKHTHLNYLNVELGKLAKERPEGPKQLASPGAALLKGMNLEELLGSIDAALLATAQRQKALGNADRGVADGGQLGQGVPPVGDGLDDDDMEAWIDELTWHGVEQNPLDASMTMQPASGAQYINGGNIDMGGNDLYLQEMGSNGENGHGQQPWDAYQLNNTVSCPDYGFQYTDSNCLYSDTVGCPQMPVPSNAIAYDGCWFDQAAMWGAHESPRDAVVPAEYYHPSLDITCNPVYMPPENSGMGTGDGFTGVSAIGLDGGGFMDASGHGYGTQCLADYFQCPDATQQYGDEPLHYLSDVADGILSCSSGTSELFAHSNSSSEAGALQFSPEQFQSDVRGQDSGVQNFWMVEGVN